jgi:hypothetical protein
MKLLSPITAFMLAAAAPAVAQVPPKPLFGTSDPLRLTLQAPLSNLIHDRETQQAISGTLIDSTGNSLPISIALRGITRRTSEICDFPPLRIEFIAPPPSASVFASQKRLKLVTHCRNTPSFQQNLLLEYAAYRMYNVLTPRSFLVRLANIDYRSADGRPIVSRAGFFIEDLDDVAKRNGTRELHAPERIPVADLSPPDAARYALFQHMISNHDWSMRAGPVGDDCCHNARLIGTLGPGTVIPVPYDFDFSGLVGASYAMPPEELHINSVRQRFYRGYCNHNPQAAAAAVQIRAARPALLNALAQVPGLEERTRARATSFLDGFFGDIATDASVNNKITGRCVLGGQP